MSVYQYISDNIILFVVFWVFVILLGVFTVRIYRHVDRPIWMKIIGVLGGSTSIYFGSLYLVTSIFDHGYPTPNPEIQTTDTLADLVLLPIQIIAVAGGALRTLNTILFNFYFSTTLWLLTMGITAYKFRPKSEVGQ